MWHNASLSRDVALFRNDPHTTSTAGWRLIICPCGMPACVTPRGTSHSPRWNLGCIRIFVKCSSLLDYIVRALLAKAQSTSTQEAVRTPWSRFELSPSTVARVACSQSLFSAGVDKTISRVYLTHFGRTYMPVKLCLFLLPPHEHTAQDILVYHR